MHQEILMTPINKKTPTEAGVQDINPSAHRPYCDKINLEFYLMQMYNNKTEKQNK